MPSTSPPASTSAKRKRRHHHRSRHGCFSCKQKHMRCDEDKPFCRNCLKNGSSCGYSRVETPSPIQPQPLLALAPDQVSSNSLLAAYLNEPATSPLEPNTAISPTPRFAAQSPWTSAFGVEMVDPFNGLPVAMGRKSNMLLDHFNNYRVLLQEPVRRPLNGEMFAWAVSDAALLHATLVLAAKHWMFLGGSKRLIESTLYQHKTKAIRIVNERLADPVAALADGTVGAVGVLVFVECLEGANEAAMIHLDGLEKMVQMRGDLHSPNMNGILQRMILLADLLTATANNSMPRFQQTPTSKTNETRMVQDSSRSRVIKQPQIVDGSFYTEIGLDDPLTKMFIDLNKLSFVLANSHHNEDGADKEVLTGGIAEAEKYIDTMLRGGWSKTQSNTKGVIAGRAFVVLSGYIYLYLFLRRIEVSSGLYDWMVSLLREDLGNVERTMRKNCSPELLFWVLFVGASGSVGRRESSWFMKELRVSKEFLSLRSWVDARASLTKFAWVEGGRDELVNERLWSGLGAA